MQGFTGHKLLEACREPGCPACRVEQQGVERYLDHQFYENVNSPPWRDHLRASLGFCREHAWVTVNQRLGDALGFSIIYHDILNSILRQWSEEDEAAPAPRRSPLFGQIPESVRNTIDTVIAALTRSKTCPACEHREEVKRTVLSTLLEGLKTPEMIEALQASDGLCLLHLTEALAFRKGDSAKSLLLTIHREKMARLQAELAEFIRKNDYQAVKEGFGSEGDAWLRALRMIAGPRSRE